MYTTQISVVMSVYNGELYLEEAIDSILNQTLKDFEFIIVNDGSTDSSLDIIQSYDDKRIIVLNQKNVGLAKALNNGITIARGKYIARMDADDISMPERLDRQLKFLALNKDYAVVGSNAEFIDMNGNYLYTSNYPLDNDKVKNLFPQSPFFHSSTMFNKQMFENTGRYNEKVKHHFEDRILWVNIAKYGKLQNIQEPLIKYRIVPSGISNRNKKTGIIYNDICNRIIQTGIVNEQDSKVLEKLSLGQTQKQKLANYYLRIGKIYIEYNFNRKKAIDNFYLSIRYIPFDKVTWFNLVLCFLPKFIIVKWKKSRGINI